MSLRTQTCVACGHDQELPAIFCGGCNSPLLKISKLFLTVFLTLTVSAFVYYGLVKDTALWPWPLYGYFAVTFVTLCYAVTRRHKLLTFRMLIWSTLLVYAMWFFFLGVGKAVTHMTSDVRDLIDVVEGHGFSQMFLGGVVAVEAVLALVLLARRFGLSTGLRVYMTFAAAAAFAGRYAFSYAAGETGAPVSVRLSDWLSWAPQTEVKEMFELVAVNIMRAVIAEMAITSFLKSYRPASEAYERLMKAGVSARRTGPGAAMLDAASRVNAAIFRAGVLLRHFAGAFVHTLASYLKALGRTLRRLFLDLILPAAALMATALLLGVLSEHSAVYITGRVGERLVWFRGVTSPLAMIALTVLLLFAVQMVFLAAVTKFPPRALWRCNALLLMWLAPFATVLFLFVSLSLIATGAVVNRYDGPAFPYRFGPLTLGAGVALLLMIAYAALAARRAGGAPVPVDAPAEVATESAEPVPAQEISAPQTATDEASPESPAADVDRRPGGESVSLFKGPPSEAPSGP